MDFNWEVIKDRVLKEVVDLAYQLHLLVLQAVVQVQALVQALVLQVVLMVLQVVVQRVVVQQVVGLMVRLPVLTARLLVLTARLLVLTVDQFPREHTELTLHLLLPFPREFLVQLRQQRLK